LILEGKLCFYNIDFVFEYGKTIWINNSSKNLLRKIQLKCYASTKMLLNLVEDKFMNIKVINRQVSIQLFRFVYIWWLPLQMLRRWEWKYWTFTILIEILKSIDNYRYCNLATENPWIEIFGCKNSGHGFLFGHLKKRVWMQL
jgi:hypothetical protein